MMDQITADVASRACSMAGGRAGQAEARTIYQRGRARWASSDIPGARRDLEAALSRGYRVAGVDLARLLLRSPADTPRAISLLEHAWHDGVSIAAFDLGELYDRGVRRTDGTTGYRLAPNAALASAWYRRGAVAGQPDALARMAEREEDIAYTGRGTAGSRAHLLAAFRYYAAAAEQARREDWPDPAWSRWRHQRASLARRLADQGLMAETAAMYDAVRRQQ